MLALTILAGTSALGGCGGGLSKLSVEISSEAGPKFAPGDTPTFTVTVTNQGPGGTGGVTVHVDLPAGFKYKATKAFTGSAVRTQPIEAAVNSTSPVWGIWNLAGPGETAVITFQATADGQPGTYNIVARSSGDNSEGETQSSPFTLQLAGAPRLSLAIAVSPGSVRQGDQVTYRVTVSNDGSGVASGLSLLVTLPPIFIYDSTIQPFGGNSSRDKGVDPFRGTLLVYYGGFNIPARSSNGPGLLVVGFKANVLKGAGATGTYTVGVQVTDDQTDRLLLNDSSPVKVA